MRIYIDEKFAKNISQTVVADLYNEAFYANPAGDISQRKGMRGVVLRKNISGHNLVIRLYRRGGLARHFLSNHFLCNPFLDFNRYRPFREFYVLKKLSSFPVPTPVAVAVKINKFTYSGIIITKEIPRALTLLEETPKKKEFVRQCVARAGEIAKNIINHGVYHPDLHLGNVLYQADGSVYLIDFDGAKILSTESQKQKAIIKTAHRWNKSIKKWMGDEPGIIKNFQEPFLEALHR